MLRQIAPATLVIHYQLSFTKKIGDRYIRDRRDVPSPNRGANTHSRKEDRRDDRDLPPRNPRLDGNLGCSLVEPAADSDQRLGCYECCFVAYAAGAHVDEVQQHAHAEHAEGHARENPDLGPAGVFHGVGGEDSGDLEGDAEGVARLC